MTLTRRETLAGVAGLALAAPLGPMIGPSHAQTTTSALGSHTVLARRLTAPVFTSPTPPVTVLSLGETFGSPVLRLRQGETSTLTVQNRLDEQITPALHGVRVPRSGPIPPSESLAWSLTPPDAGSYLLRTLEAGPQARGLCALVIVEEREPPAVDRDLPLLMQHLVLSNDGAALDPGGLPANTDVLALRSAITVNGRPIPYEIPVRPNERLRVRLANGTVGGAIAIGFSAQGPTLVARDGQPAEPTAARQPIVLGPGQRVEWIADMPDKPGEALFLVAFGDRPTPLLRFMASGEPLPARPTGSITPLPRSAADTRIDLRRAIRHRLELDSHEGAVTLISSQTNCVGRCPLFRARRDIPVVLTLKATRGAAALSLAGQVLRPLDRLDDGWKPWLQDTVIVTGEEALFAFVPTDPGRFEIEAVGLDARARRTTGYFTVE